MPVIKRILKLFLQLLLQMALVALIYFVLMQYFFKRYIAETGMNEYLSDKGMKAGSFSGMVEGLKCKANELSAKLNQQQKDMDRLLERGSLDTEEKRPDRFIYAVKSNRK